MARHNQLGKQGEQAACDFLLSKGFIIRETNWRMGHLEIDIIAQEPQANLLHIVEVKTRKDDQHAELAEVITKRKINNLVNAANGYISYHQLAMEVQYDVIFLIGNEPDFELHYFPDAFQPPLRHIR